MLPPHDCPRRHISSVSPTRGKLWASRGVLGRHLFERESSEKQEEEKSSSSSTSRVHGKKKIHGAIQNGTIFGFFFFALTVYETTPFWTKHAFSFKRKIKTAKTCQSPNQSLICNLFNQVLNCNFDLKFNAIASLPKIKQRP